MFQKQRIFNLAIFPMIIFLTSSTTSVDVQSNASSQVSGEGKVEMHVSSEVNGVKKESSSDQPGEIEVSIKEDGVNSEAKAESSVSPTPSSSPRARPRETDDQIRNLEQQIRQLIDDLFNKLSNIFK